MLDWIRQERVIKIEAFSRMLKPKIGVFELSFCLVRGRGSGRGGWLHYLEKKAQMKFPQYWTNIRTLAPFERSFGSLQEPQTFNVHHRYPDEPPIVRFVTPIYHPNIDPQGRICLHILNTPPTVTWVEWFALVMPMASLSALVNVMLECKTCRLTLSQRYHGQSSEIWQNSGIEDCCALKGSWNSELGISAVLVHIGLLLTEPNPDDALMNQIVSTNLDRPFFCVYYFS